VSRVAQSRVLGPHVVRRVPLMLRRVAKEGTPTGTGGGGASIQRAVTEVYG
jgi:hypothetical protein